MKNKEIHGSFLRTGKPKDRSAYRAFRLEDALRENSTPPKRKRRDLMSEYFTGPGWWAMLDRELQDMYDIDPQLSGVIVEEKYGHARVRYETHSPNRRDLLRMHREIIHRLSGETCELCGAPGSIGEEIGWVSCWCERCRNATPDERRQIEVDTAARYRSIKKERGN